MILDSNLLHSIFLLFNNYEELNVITEITNNKIYFISQTNDKKLICQLILPDSNSISNIFNEKQNFSFSPYQISYLFDNKKSDQIEITICENKIIFYQKNENIEIENKVNFNNIKEKDLEDIKQQINITNKANKDNNKYLIDFNTLFSIIKRLEKIDSVINIKFSDNKISFIINDPEINLNFSILTEESIQNLNKSIKIDITILSYFLESFIQILSILNFKLKDNKIFFSIIKDDDEIETIKIYTDYFTTPNYTIKFEFSQKKFDINSDLDVEDNYENFDDYDIKIEENNNIFI